MKQLIKDFTKEQLRELIKPSFRANQIFNWLYVKYADSFSKMSNLSKELKSELEEKYSINGVWLVKKEESSDGSIKYLFRLHDNHTIESVLLKMKEGEVDEDGNILSQAKYTVCLSTQVGCKVGCTFCLTATGGFVRNLTAGEIVDQIVFIKRDNNFDSNKRVNIVYMGMGEPLDNLDNVVSAIKIFSDEDGLNISPRRQTISTSGISSKIEKLGKMDLKVQLAISLHSVDDKQRTELMPINKAYNIESIINAIKKFPIDNRKRVMFEYLMIKDVNDDLESAKKLVKLLSKIKAKVNLILFNPNPYSPFQRPESQKVVAFQEYLLSKNLLCTIRQSKGLDISAACGQLKEQNLNEELKGICHGG